MNNAKFYSEIADGPSDGAAYWAKTDDDVRLRVGTYGTKKGSKGTILIFLGRFGYVERYGRVAKQFAQNGFASVVVDWRSQGLSDRLTEDRQTGHINSFADYQMDVKAALGTAEELGLAKPFYLLGVSMGATIGLRALHEGLPVAACAMISPMWSIKMSAIERVAAWPLSWAAQKFGFGHRYVPGENGDIYTLKTAFEKNNMTHNPDMYQYWVAQARSAPELHIGGPSLAWLYQGLSECRRLSKISSPDIPCLTFCGELDELVDNRAIVDRMDRWPNGKLQIIKNVKHDPLTELSEVAGDPVDQICVLFENSTPK